MQRGSRRDEDGARWTGEDWNEAVAELGGSAVSSSLFDEGGPPRIRAWKTDVMLGGTTRRFAAALVFLRVGGPLNEGVGRGTGLAIGGCLEIGDEEEPLAGENECGGVGVRVRGVTPIHCQSVSSSKSSKGAWLEGARVLM